MPDRSSVARGVRRRLRRPLRKLHRRLVIQPRASYVVSYPKSGRTWLRLLLGEIFASLTKQPLSLDLTRYRDGRLGIPYILFSHDGTDRADRQSDLADKRRFAGRPVVLLVRDPRDVMVSYYFHLTRRTHQFAGDLEAFVRSPQYGIDRMIAFLNSWSTHSHVPSRFHVVRYEEFHADAAAVLRRVLEFFDVRRVPDAVVLRAVEQAAFPRMKEMEARGLLVDGRLRPANPADPESYKVRRGHIGGYAEYFSPQQVDFLNARLRQGLRPPYSTFWL